ncbi:hypothetical protein BKA61DRAFT_208247 [Leptodontidium sp. MPI-SDFR-AT-0119]|nr:hypothetical protein BKA61DRAFT_208247 [Leptodontidium sp. MPI-SDFR-AT-0119]
MVQIVTRRLFYLSAATTTLGVEGAQHAGQIALHAAFSLLLGLGTEISGTEGGKWLCYSALCGNVIAICTLSEIYDVFPGFLEGVERLVPLDIFLSLTALAGSNSVLAKLEIRNQHFASHVKSLRQSLDITAIALARLKAKAAPFLAGLVMAYCASAVSTAEPDVMADAIRTRNVEEILHAAEIRLGLVGLETGASLRSDALHYLSYFCDPMSAQLASKLVDSGAKLDYKLGMGSLSTLNRIKQAFGTAEWTEGRALARPSENPLLRAVNQANVSLAMALIDLHEIHGVPLVMPLLSLTKAASLHLSAVVGRLLSLGKQKPLLCNLQQADWAPGTVGLGAYPPEVISLLAEQITITTENVLGSCALLVMRPYGNIYFRRLAIHGRDAPRRETEVLEVILDALQDAGVDAWPAYFKCCLAWDLVNPLKAGMDRLRKAGCDPLPVMARVFSPKPLLKSCVTHRAYQCLQELVSNSTLLVQQDSIGLTALHTVAAADDRVALRILMNAGGRQLADIKSFNGESAIDFAVYSGNTDIATTIYDAEINTTAQSFSALRPSTARISTDTFVRLVLNWRRNRSVKLLDSLRWLFQNAPCCPLRARKMQPLSENDMRLAIADEVEGGGQDFPPVCPQDWEEIVTIWHEIISTPFCGPANQMSLDRLFLCELFARFPRHVSFVDCKGWTSLHLAVWNGHVAAVELLLALGVDVNSETDPRPGRPPHIRGLASFFPGRTALNLATEALMRSPPLAVESAGYAEIVEWGARLRAIIRLLARNGAASGSGAGKREVVAAERFTKPNVRVNFYGLQAIESRRQRITYSGVWPQTIINRTPSAVSEKDAVTWWSNSCPVTSDYFDGEYGVWPDLPWLGTVDEINERQEAEAAQVARLSGLIAAKRVLSTKSDIRVTANGSVCMFDTNEEIWWEETEWRETTAESMLDVEGLDLNK